MMFSLVIDVMALQYNIPIAFRNGLHSEWMKQNVWSVNQIHEQLKGSPKETLFIGDCKREYECSQNFGCHFIRMAPTNKKRKRLRTILQDKMIVNDYYELMQLYYGAV